MNSRTGSGDKDGPPLRPKIIPITGGGFAFLHPCSVCGEPVAPFGYGVHLRTAKPGTWFCFDHRKEHKP